METRIRQQKTHFPCLFLVGEESQSVLGGLACRNDRFAQSKAISAHSLSGGAQLGAGGWTFQESLTLAPGRIHQ
ncbi:MAG: hypothetical protein DWH91_18405 [Planctomycetota bacterium]|nr:MAG: hypothetical protein DWH91_18405 [Planctomycetota bacterium]